MLLCSVEIRTLNPVCHGDYLMKELIAKLGCTETYDKENVLIDIFIYLLENRIQLTDGLQVFMELSKLRDRTFGIDKSGICEWRFIKCVYCLR